MTEGVLSPRSLGIVCTSSTAEDCASLSWASASKWNLEERKKKERTKSQRKTGKGLRQKPQANISDFAASEESLGGTRESVSRIMLSSVFGER